MAVEIPVYLFTGFLEAGKTRLIQETMEDAEFNAGEPTLILLTEEGEGELDPSSFAKGAENVCLCTVESLEDLTEKAFRSFYKEFPYRRLLIECNGMWQIGEIYRRLPREYVVYQEIMVADSRTFPAYNANLRSLAVDKLQGCEMVIFNRVSDAIDKMELHKIVRGISRGVNIAYEYESGEIEYDEIEDPLPFDLEADVVEIADRDFALFFRDITEEMPKYNGKTVRYRALIARDDRLGPCAFVAGRQVMTCCADDIAYNGFVSITSAPTDLAHGSFAVVEGRIAIEQHAMYRHPGPVLYIRSIEKTDAPEEKVATFY